MTDENGIIAKARRTYRRLCELGAPMPRDAQWKVDWSAVERTTEWKMALDIARSASDAEFAHS